MPYIGSILGRRQIGKQIDNAVKQHKLAEKNSRLLKPWFFAVWNVLVSAAVPKVFTDKRGQTVHYASFSGINKTFENE